MNISVYVNMIKMWSYTFLAILSKEISLEETYMNSPDNIAELRDFDKCVNQWH